MRGSALALLCALAAGCTALVGDGPDDADAALADEEAAWALVRDEYPFLDFKQVDWAALHASFRSRAETARGDEVLPILWDMMAALQDGHVAILPRGGGLPVIPWMPPRTLRDLPLFRAEVVHGYLPLQLAADDHVEWGRTADGVGYVYIGSFADGTWGYDLDPVLAALRDVRALIVDVRHNGGGSTTPADAILGRFLRAERPAPPMFRHGQPQAARSLYPRGPFTWQKPVVLLIDGVSFSAAEYFADALRQEPIVTVVGRATGGGGGNYGYYPLPSGTRLRLPWQEFRRLDGQEIEWTGVSPDLEVVQDPDHLAAGQDDQLEAALALALARR